MRLICPCYCNAVIIARYIACMGVEGMGGGVAGVCWFTAACFLNNSRSPGVEGPGSSEQSLFHFKVEVYLCG
jgi:hypothetical protein